MQDTAFFDNHITLLSHKKGQHVIELTAKDIIDASHKIALLRVWFPHNMSRDKNKILISGDKKFIQSALETLEIEYYFISPTKHKELNNFLNEENKTQIRKKTQEKLAEITARKKQTARTPFFITPPASSVQSLGKMAPLLRKP